MTDDNRQNIIIFLLVMAFFTGATIQINDGSELIGVVMFLIALALISRIRLSGEYITRTSKFFIAIGAFIIIADIAYNLKSMDQLGTVDSMTFFLGLSFIAYGMSNEQYRRMGDFGIYMSGTFLVLFFTFYTLLPLMNNNFIYYFDHYFVLLPSIAIARLFSNLEIHMAATETVHFSGIEDTTIVIGGPCSGLYSMFLLVGIIVGYAKMERLRNFRQIGMLIFLAIIVAYIANLVRVAVLYHVAYYYGREKMMFVHVHLGWIIFLIISIGIMTLLNKIKR
jgi:archaeosortase C (PEF-CTERM variant)